MTGLRNDSARRRAAKLFNERVKLLATFANNSAIATFVGGYLLPYVRPDQSGSNGWSGPLWIIGYVLILHGMAQLVLTLFRSEE